MAETPSPYSEEFRGHTQGEPAHQSSKETEATASFYQACIENQELYRQRGTGHEMPHLSQRIEEEAKRIFRPYIDPNFPRVLISWNIVADSLYEQRNLYHNYETSMRLPEHVAETDRTSYTRGIRAMNEWATNYATRHYLEEETNSIFPKGLRAIYGRMHDDVQTISYGKAYTMMRRIEAGALARHIDFSDTVFQALFQHNFVPLNNILASQSEIPAKNLDELALIVGKNADKSLHQLTRLLIPPQRPRPADNTGSTEQKGIATVVQKVEQVLVAVAAQGYVAQPGIARVMLPSNIITGGIGAKFAAVHESMHAYSSSPDYLGLIPRNLIPPKQSPPESTK